MAKALMLEPSTADISKKLAALAARLPYLAMAGIVSPLRPN
jgi:hypothetical protein